MYAASKTKGSPRIINNRARTIAHKNIFGGKVSLRGPGFSLTNTSADGSVSPSFNPSLKAAPTGR